MALTTYTWRGINGAFTSTGLWTPTAFFKTTSDFLVSGTATTSMTFTTSATADLFTINNANATVTFGTAGKKLTINNTNTSGIVLTAGNIVFGSSGTVAARILTVNGGTLTSTANNAATVSVANVLSLSSTGSIVMTSGVLAIGATTGTGGTATVAGTGSLLVTGGQLSLGNFKVTGGTFNQSAGTITNTGTATFSGGTDTISGGLFSAGSVAVGTAFSLNGGTLQSTSSGISVSGGTVLTIAGGTLDGTTGGIANAGTITGIGVLTGSITGTGTVVATGGTLEIVNNVAASTNTLNVLTGSVLKLDGTVGANVNLGGATTTGVIEFGNAAALTNFTGTIANLDIGASATSVNGFEFINLQGVSVDHIKIGGVPTNVFNGVANTVTLFDASNASLGIITLASAPIGGTNFDWAADSTANGNALGGTDLFLSSVVCFGAGTLIQTETGEMPVEALAEGDRVVTLQDGHPVPMPVKWMGIRMIDIARHPHPHTVAPIRIRAGAVGDELPRRDLLVSPAHAIYLDGKLVPANLLINHMTIVQDLHTTSVTYYHVEMDRHSLILAEGLTSESYLDTGNRAYFSNAGLAMVLHPEFHVNAGLKQWEDDACAPLAIDAETVTPIWQALADRAETLGYVPPRFTTTTDADMYLEANGRRLRPVAVANGRHTFILPTGMLPAGANSIVLKSRTSAPADLDPLSGDWRPLGVAVRAMTFHAGDDRIVIPADHPGLIQGWHSAEAGNGDVWRWTTGHAAIPLLGIAGPAMLDIDIGAMGTYILTRSDRETRRLAA